MRITMFIIICAILAGCAQSKRNSFIGEKSQSDLKEYLASPVETIHTCPQTKRAITVFLKSAVVQLLCGEVVVKELVAVVVQRRLLPINFRYLPRTTTATKVFHDPSWRPTAGIIQRSGAVDRLHRPHTAGNPYEKVKIRLSEMGAIYIHDVNTWSRQYERRRSLFLQPSEKRYASNGCVNLQTQDVDTLLIFLGYQRNQDNMAWRQVPITFTSG